MRIKPFVLGFIGTNCFLVWDEASKNAMIIDPGAYEKVISKEIKENGLFLKYILLTHGHGDHIGGVPDFRTEFPEAQLVCGEGDLALIGDTGMNSSGDFFGSKIVLAPDMTPGEGDVLRLGEISIEVLQTPGHTKGGLSFYVAGCDTELTEQQFSGTVFSGDTLFHLSVGRTDLQGGDFIELKASIKEKLFSLPDDTLVFRDI